MNKYILCGAVGLSLHLTACQSLFSKKNNTQPDIISVTQVDSSKFKKQEAPAWIAKRYKYNPSRSKYNDLIHTKLEVKFDWEKQYLYGTATLDLKPYFYPQDSLILDAKGFDIASIELVTKNGTSPLNYNYNNKQIYIKLNKTYTRTETYTIKIKYTAKPNELPKGGSDAITSDKGLYFINADGKDPKKPKQIWTQGETEASSCWFPTIDSPNEKTTQEIAITVDKKYITLSNGTLVYSAQNEDGTRTDLWKQEKPHAPYLFMMTVGEFAVVKDKWRNVEVNYLVEPKYKPYAKAIFGNTPEMMEFFSNKLGYAYPWDKYSQIVVRDYVSGAMENTSATIMMEALQATSRELLDENWDGIIAHELFHHWFGDLVTCESWSNLPLNESFANYSEYLWEEYKYGKDAADYHALDEKMQYLAESKKKQEPLIRYYYNDREDMFDSHSYAKGGRILHMLRNYVGDEAFFTSLQNYLKKNEFKDAEINHLRLAFEEVTGEDLNWFFDQYFMKPGHANLLIDHKYENNKLTVQVAQIQDSLYTPIYKIPVKIDIWVNGEKKRYPVTITKAYHKYEFDFAQKPDLFLFDGEQQLLAEIDHKKSVDELIFQYKNSDKFEARFNALVGLLENKDDKAKVNETFKLALNDPFWNLREAAIEYFTDYKEADSLALEAKLKTIAQTDVRPSNKAKAIEVLASRNPKLYKDVFEKAILDSAYSVVGAGLKGISKTYDKEAVSKILSVYEKESSPIVSKALSEIYAENADTTKYAWFESKLNELVSRDLYYFTSDFGLYLSKMPKSIQLKSVALLKPMVLNHEIWYCRLGAFKALLKMPKLDEAVALKNEAREKEKDQKLIDRYKKLDK